MQGRCHMCRIMKKRIISSFKKSFVPDVINQWNLLQIDARETTSLNIKKNPP